MPSQIAKIVFAILTVVIFIIIVVLAITLSLKDGEEAKLSGILGILKCFEAPLLIFSLHIHSCIAALMETKKNKKVLAQSTARFFNP